MSERLESDPLLAVLVELRDMKQRIADLIATVNAAIIAQSEHYERRASEIIREAHGDAQMAACMGGITPEGRALLRWAAAGGVAKPAPPDGHMPPPAHGCYDAGDDVDGES